MKTKLLSVLMVALIALMAVSASARPMAPTCQPTQVIGDYDNDRDVDFYDVWNLLNYVRAYDFQGNTACYDIDRNGNVDFEDFRLADTLFIGLGVQDHILGLTNYPMRYVYDCRPGAGQSAIDGTPLEASAIASAVNELGPMVYQSVPVSDFVVPNRGMRGKNVPNAVTLPLRQNTYLMQMRNAMPNGYCARMDKNSDNRVDIIDALLAAQRR